MTSESPTPKLSLPWIVNPQYGKSNDFPPVFEDDRILVAIPRKENSCPWNSHDFQVITATRDGFRLADSDPDYWDWSWKEVSHYIPLDGARTQQDLENLE